MLIDFTGEKMPRADYSRSMFRHKVAGGWYVRIVMTNNTVGGNAENECVLFLTDPEHSWQLNSFKWEKIEKEFRGGIFRAKTIGGWIIFSTAQGKAKTEEGTRYYPRIGSLIFIPDPKFDWECEILGNKT